MPNKPQDRRTDRATADEVAEMERQLWEFARRIDPPGVPEAKLRPGAFLWRIHRTWHSLGRGTGGLASRSFRALRDELLARDPPVRNLQPKLYGNTAMLHAEAEQLIDVMLETWHLERGRNGKWQARPITHPKYSKTADSRDLEAIRENMLHTLFRGEDALLLEEPVGIAPEIFVGERGKTSLALIIPTKGETAAHFSPFNAYGSFSSGIGHFFDAALERAAEKKSVPLMIWVLRMDVIRDNAEFHQSFHSLAIYSACLTNWYFRLRKMRKSDEDQHYWNMITRHSAFVVHGLPEWICRPKEDYLLMPNTIIDEDLVDLGPEFMVPYTLPIMMSNHRHVKRHRNHDFGLTVSVESDPDNERPCGGRLNYWLHPDSPTSDLEETAETTGLPVFDAEMSPGKDFDLAYVAIYEAVAHRLGIVRSKRSSSSLKTLQSMGWRILRIQEFQASLLVSETLAASAKLDN